MKKAYSKPEIVFESFSLSTNIAGDCEEIVGNPAKGTCGVLGNEPGIDNLFSSSVTGIDGCQMWMDVDVYNGFCYHVPEDTHELFNS